jgi:hypothetical protein
MSAPNGQVRAVASLKLERLAARLRTSGAAKTEADQAQHALLAADIKRYLERPSADPSKIVPPAAAPPGAPIGDPGQDWLARPAWCDFDDAQWLAFPPPQM